MDKIIIDNLEIFAYHGVFPEETKLGQKFLVSLILYLDTRKAGISDDLAHSVNYGEVSHFAAKCLTERTFRLIEAAAEHLAEQLLCTYSIEAVTVTLKKPWAPIGLPLESVGVEVTRKWHRVFLALGSNLGDRQAYIRQGIKALSETDGCQVKRVSKLIETKPYGVTEQDDFLNGCLELRTLLSAQELLNKLHEIEAAAERKRELRWGPRTLDLDILLYDGEIIETPELTIPHVDMANRSFVLQPLCEIAPYCVHPVYRKTITELLAELRERK